MVPDIHRELQMQLQQYLVKYSAQLVQKNSLLHPNSVRFAATNTDLAPNVVATTILKQGGVLVAEPN